MSPLTSVSTTQGLRQYMEDTVLIENIIKNNTKIDMMCVFDGHGGSEVSDFCKKEFKNIFQQFYNKEPEFDIAIRQTYKHLDLKCSQFKQTCGSTAITVFRKNNELWIANCGDSEAMVKLVNGKSYKVSQCHKVENEKNRLIEEGAMITYDDGCARINQMLNVARSFGDYHLKKYVISMPYIKCIRLDKIKVDYLIIASDGLWDVYDTNTLSKEIDVLREICLSNGKNIKEATDIISYEIVKRSILKGSTDNISVVLYIL